ncbi:uncharacterized protein Dsimw501_GD28789 [Drosophila simulans]|uniref:Uncharacterized protein n=1 Tax=Drosophila simulans TaxID=7240 RepID=A0A0J9RXJ8_DROSI|nr:uncharacterized protein Dsimw501_GD28789 [Drosophila simulans]
MRLPVRGIQVYAASGFWRTAASSLLERTACNNSANTNTGCAQLVDRNRIARPHQHTEVSGIGGTHSPIT